jgi:hypothetical protein
VHAGHCKVAPFQPDRINGSGTPYSLDQARAPPDDFSNFATLSSAKND